MIIEQCFPILFVYFRTSLLVVADNAEMAVVVTFHARTEERVSKSVKTSNESSSAIVLPHSLASCVRKPSEVVLDTKENHREFIQSFYHPQDSKSTSTVISIQSQV